jgi:hypothetical protein
MSVTAMPVVAPYGQVQNINRAATPHGLGAKHVFGVYNELAITLWTLGFMGPIPDFPSFDGNEALAVGTIAWGFGATDDPPINSMNEAKELQEIWDVVIVIDWEHQFLLEKTPVRFSRHSIFTYPNGDPVYPDGHWEWRFGASFKPGEFADIIGLGPFGNGFHNFVYQEYYDGNLAFDSSWFADLWFELY